VKFPKRIKFRGRVFTTIYAKTKAYPAYRVAWSIHGKRQMKAFDRFGGKDGAQKFAEKTAKDLATGSQVAALTSAQAADALAALERLQAFYQSTGKRSSLVSAVCEFAESSALLRGHTLREAVTGFLRNTASVKRKDIAEAVEEFIQLEEPRPKAKDGQRAQLSAKYHYNRNHPSPVCGDLSKYGRFGSLQSASGHILRFTWESRIRQIAQSSCRHIGEVSQSPLRHGPAVSSMGGAKRFHLPGSSPRGSRFNAARAREHR